MSEPFTPAIVIAGMHRSGTSLAASLVVSAGVHLGERLMGPERGNPKGHFEDLDFYELHQQALAANGLGGEGFTCHERIAVPPAIDEAFTTLVGRRRGLGQPWGWKDPRTTLFLEAWLEKLPEAVFLFIVRKPWEVVDSLLRRGDRTFALNPRLAADVWLSYNRRIHEFVVAHRDRCLVVDSTRVARDPAGLIAEVGRLMGVELRRPEERYDPTLLVEDASFDRAGLLGGMLPEAIELYASLCRLADPRATTSATAPVIRQIVREPRLEAVIDAAAMQWVRAARADERARLRELELAASCRELAATVAERDELARTIACLTAERDAALGQLHTSGQAVAALTASLAIARRRKTVRERLLINGRRLVRQALGVFGLLRPARQPGGV